MSLRKTLNANPVIVGIIVVIIAAVAVWFSVRQTVGSGPRQSGTYFTNDDGATWFTGTKDDVPPFDKDGKEAVRAYIFECNGKEFVGYMERYTPKVKAAMLDALAAAREKRPPKDMGTLMSAGTTGREMKRPGDKQWVVATPGKALGDMTTVKCSDGTTALPKNQ